MGSTPPGGWPEQAECAGRATGQGPSCAPHFQRNGTPRRRRPKTEQVAAAEKLSSWGLLVCRAGSAHRQRVPIDQLLVEILDVPLTTQRTWERNDTTGSWPGTAAGHRAWSRSATWPAWRGPVAGRGELPGRQGPRRPGRAPGPPPGLLAPVDHPGDARPRLPHHPRHHYERHRARPRQRRARPDHPGRGQTTVHRPHRDRLQDRRTDLAWSAGDDDTNTTPAAPTTKDAKAASPQPTGPIYGCSTSARSTAIAVLMTPRGRQHFQWWSSICATAAVNSQCHGSYGPEPPGCAHRGLSHPCSGPCALSQSQRSPA